MDVYDRFPGASKCCFCVNLKTGVTILAICACLDCLFRLISFFYYYHTMHEHWWDNFIRLGTTLVEILFAILTLALSILLLIGISKEKEIYLNFFVPAFNISLIFFIFHCVGSLILKTSILRVTGYFLFYMMYGFYANSLRMLFDTECKRSAVERALSRFS